MIRTGPEPEPVADPGTKPLTYAELDAWEARVRRGDSTPLLSRPYLLQLIAAERRQLDRHSHITHALAGHPLGRSRLEVP